MNLKEIAAHDNTFMITAPPPFEYYLPKSKVYGRSVEVRTEPKIGRNQPCPCGSGVKYKKCCEK